VRAGVRKRVGNAKCGEIGGEMLLVGGAWVRGSACVHVTVHVTIIWRPVVRVTVDIRVHKGALHSQTSGLNDIQGLRQTHNFIIL
jgi:hypothetical protein